MNAVEKLFDVFLKAANGIHRGVLSISGGRIGRSFGSMEVVELHTTGRRSGKRRTVMLTSPIHDDGRYVLVASKGGDDRHPEWYRNLTADPDVELTVGGETIPMTARTATAEERAAMWPDVVKAYRGYADYQRRTQREIPLVICEPRRR